jgi:hypothetical protein
MSAGHTTFREAAAGDRHSRIVVDVAVGVNGIQLEVVVDTGGTWIVLDPDVARLAGIVPQADDESMKLSIRGEVWEGHLVRDTLVLLAEEGPDVQIEGTFFVPDVGYGDAWRYPSFLGWSGGLERVRFAVDPGRRRFSFAELDQG